MSYDPCVELAKLKKQRIELAASGGEKSIRFGDEETEYHKPNAARLDAEIQRLERECAISQGLEPKRTRYAKGAHFTR